MFHIICRYNIYFSIILMPPDIRASIYLMLKIHPDFKFPIELVIVEAEVLGSL